MLRITLVVILTLFFCSPSAAEIYKCRDESGRLQFSDKPCGDDAEVLKGYSGDNGTSVSGTVTPELLASPHLLLDDGNIQPFVKVLSFTVGGEDRWPASSEQGIFVFHNGVKRLIEFDKLVSLRVLDYDKKYCGNTGYLCSPTVEVKTSETTFNTDYTALHNIRVLIDDDLGGGQQELTVWFGKRHKLGKENRMRIRSVQFASVETPKN